MILRIPTRKYTHQRQLKWHPLWKPSLRSEDYTSNDTLCDSRVLDLRTRTVTASSWICEPWPLHPPDDTSNDTLWQPGLTSANPDPYTYHTTPPTTPCDSPVLHLRTLTLHIPHNTSNDTLCDSPSWICEPWPLHTPHNTSNDTLCDSPPATNPQKSANPHPPTWSQNPYS